MSNIEKIRQEIERRRDICKGIFERDSDTYYQGKSVAYDEALSFIDSLPEEKPSEDLEKAASRLGFDYVDNIVHESPEHRWNDHDVEFGYRDGFIAGAKWMNNQVPMPEDTVIFMKGVAEGRRLEREEMEENKRKEDELPRYYGD